MDDESQPFIPLRRFFKGSIFLLLVLLPVLVPAFLTAQESPVSLAVLPFENMNDSPDQNYLKGIITSLLIEDLSGSQVVTVVERDNLEEVFKEQKLQLAGFLDDKGAIKAGKLLGASYMLKGGYVFLGQDVFINITLIDVETGGAEPSRNGDIRKIQYMLFQKNSLST